MPFAETSVARPSRCCEYDDADVFADRAQLPQVAREGTLRTPELGRVPRKAYDVVAQEDCEHRNDAREVFGGLVAHATNARERELLRTVHAPKVQRGLRPGPPHGWQHAPLPCLYEKLGFGVWEGRSTQAAARRAGFPSFRLGAGARGIAVGGRQRDWLVAVGDADGWFHATTVVCRLPAETGARARLLHHVLRLNRSLNLVKFSLGDEELSLEADYRTQHADETVTGELLRYLTAAAEEHYPAIFRIVSGDDMLKALETSF